MKGLSWFQARDLAVAEKRAIRRDGWTWWLLYRFKVWIISQADSSGNEQRRVVQNIDFGANEFMAKDWTDELWNGGTFPPCCNTTPATGLTDNTSGGGGAWTYDDNCAGAGDGGGVPAVPFVSPEEGITAEFLPYGGGEFSYPWGDPLGPTTPAPNGGAGTCWNLAAPPFTYNMLLTYTVSPSILPATWNVSTAYAAAHPGETFPTAANIWFWFDHGGDADFDAYPATWLDPIPGAEFYQPHSQFIPSRVSHTDGSDVPGNQGWIFSAPSPATIVPGRVVKARITVTDAPLADEHGVVPPFKVLASRNLEFTFAPECSLS